MGDVSICSQPYIHTGFVNEVRQVAGEAWSTACPLLLLVGFLLLLNELL